MPSGKVLNPRVNIGGNSHPESGFKDYGFLTESETGHVVMYVKDRNSKGLSHGSPVEYEQVKLELIVKGQEVTLDLAFITDVETGMDDHPAVRRTNEAIQSYLSEEENTGADKRLCENLRDVDSDDIKKKVKE